MSKNRFWKKATEGTYADAALSRRWAAAFLAVAFAVMLVPLVGMVWARTDFTTENRELAAAPALFAEDGSFNWNVLADAGTYFEDHFAYRNQAVTANAQLRAALGTSATDQVVIGSNGWLFYGGTLPDYLGQGMLGDRSLANIAHNLKLAQDYASAQGSTFVFTLAPNKNTLDVSNMPYYYLRYKGSSNAQRLKPFLDEAGVSYVDLFDVFEGRMAAEEGFGYLKQDSHWNNRWAALASNALLQAAGRPALDLDVDAGTVRDDFEGDLQSMLYPSAQSTEVNYYYAGYNDEAGMSGALWRYDEGSAVTDSVIKTSASGAQGSLLMFRDSFGNALVPLWAASFKSATFSKMVPYNLTQNIDVKADVVVVERAERHLGYLASNPPIMSNPRRSFAEGLPPEAMKAQASVNVSTSGAYWVVQGSVDGGVDGQGLSASSRIHVVAQVPGSDPVVFDPFWVSSADDATGDIVDEQGFLLYAPTSSVDLSAATISVYVS